MINSYKNQTICVLIVLLCFALTGCNTENKHVKEDLLIGDTDVTENSSETNAIKEDNNFLSMLVDTDYAGVEINNVDSIEIKEKQKTEDYELELDCIYTDGNVVLCVLNIYSDSLAEINSTNIEYEIICEHMESGSFYSEEIDTVNENCTSVLLVGCLDGIYTDKEIPQEMILVIYSIDAGGKNLIDVDEPIEWITEVKPNVPQVPCTFTDGADKYEGYISPFQIKICRDGYAEESVVVGFKNRKEIKIAKKIEFGSDSVPVVGEGRKQYQSYMWRYYFDMYDIDYFIVGDITYKLNF